MKRAALIMVFVVFGLLGYYSYGLFLNSARFNPVNEGGSNSVSIPLLAVGDNNEGVVIPLSVQLTPGTGKILVNIDNPSFIQDTQDSMRLAVKEAAQMTNTDESKYDVTFSISTNISLIGGPSAGAAMTLATMALMLNKQLKEDVAITGTIEEGGYIGQVGGVAEKAAAAESSGVTLLLVPIGESISREPVENCTTVTTGRWRQKECFITYQTVNISQDVGIAVKEVDTISEAMKYIIA
jgi:uncharacterized protein